MNTLSIARHFMQFRGEPNYGLNIDIEFEATAFNHGCLTSVNESKRYDCCEVRMSNPYSIYTKCSCQF